MQDLVTALVPLGDWAAQFMLIVARLSFVVMLMPGIGEQVYKGRELQLPSQAVAAATEAAG